MTVRPAVPQTVMPARAHVAGFALAAALFFSVAGCDDRSHRDIGDEINILTRRNDALVPPAIERLARYGRLAIPQIETALHTAAPTGRLHLIAVLDRIGDDEAIPVLGHFAVYDVSGDVRQACDDLLARWASDPAAAANVGAGKGARRADRARLAQAEVSRKRSAGQGPLVFEGGVPGVPTVGAPAPVGGDTDLGRR